MAVRVLGATPCGPQVTRQPGPSVGAMSRNLVTGNMAATGNAVTQADFARRKGVSRKTVTKWKEKGLLSMTPDGRVKVEESERLLADRPVTYRGGSVTPSTQAVVQQGETPEAAAERIVKEGGAPYPHAEAVRIKENYLALLRQLEFDIKSGAVVPIDVVIAGVVEQNSRVRTKMLAIPTRVAPRAAVLRSADEVRALLEADVIQALKELTLDGEGDVSLDDLRRIIRERFGSIH